MLHRLLVILLLSVAHTVATAAPQAPATADQVAAERLALDKATHEFTKTLEREKLDIERQKAWINGLSYMVPLMVAALSFLLGVRNQAEQSRLQRESQEKTALAQFELKAAEIVLAERGAVGTLNKARVLKALFPHRLPEDFIASFDPADFQSTTGEGGLDAKIKFFEIAAQEMTDERQLATLWRKLFPGDRWTDRVTQAPAPPHGDA